MSGQPSATMQMPMRRVIPFAAVALVATAVASLDAHDTWLLPSAARATVGQRLDLHMSSGMTFARDDLAIEPSRVGTTVARLAGKTGPLPAGTVRGGALLIPWTPAAPGVATIGISLAPKNLDLAANLIEVYFLDINADAQTRAQWAAIPAPKQWRERYAKHAVSYVCVAGAPRTDSSWAKPVGLGLEIVPASDPTRLRAGDSLRVQVLWRGAPLPNFQLGAFRDGEDKPVFARTGRDGRATARFPLEGWWLLHGTHLRRATDASHEWDSDFTTTTVRVGKAGAATGC